VFSDGDQLPVKPVKFSDLTLDADPKANAYVPVVILKFKVLPSVPPD
jgi:hypothetical protein